MLHFSAWSSFIIDFTIFALLPPFYKIGHAKAQPESESLSSASSSHPSERAFIIFYVQRNFIFERDPLKLNGNV